MRQFNLSEDIDIEKEDKCPIVKKPKKITDIKEITLSGRERTKQILNIVTIIITLYVRCQIQILIAGKIHVCALLPNICFQILKKNIVQ